MRQASCTPCKQACEPSSLCESPDVTQTGISYGTYLTKVQESKCITAYIVLLACVWPPHHRAAHDESVTRIRLHLCNCAGY
eukprot:283396-Chlamydomonas_euryale.AAC.4